MALNKRAFLFNLPKNRFRDLINCVKKYQPDYMVVGDDYRNKIIYGSEYAKELIFYEKIPNYSTTKILKYENKETQ